MIVFRAIEESFTPCYMTKHSAGADVRAREPAAIPPLSVGKIPTGLWIERIRWDEVPAGFVPEVQLRARSGLAFKHGIMLANGVGTVDADYPDEICVLLYNSNPEKAFNVQPGDRIAQLVVNLVYRPSGFVSFQERSGGFGSTDIKRVQG